MSEDQPNSSSTQEQKSTGYGQNSYGASKQQTEPQSQGQKPSGYPQGTNLPTAGRGGKGGQKNVTDLFKMMQNAHQLHYGPNSQQANQQQQTQQPPTQNNMSELEETKTMPSAEQTPNYSYPKKQKNPNQKKQKNANPEKDDENANEPTEDVDEIDKEFSQQQKEIQKEMKTDDMQKQWEMMQENMNSRREDDVRVAVIGNVDSGKSTMVGVLTKSIMDDGRGSARKQVFNFSHEAANGRTSSIGQEIMGFDTQNEQVIIERLQQTKNQSWQHVATKSSKLVTFLDLCGHEKYLKTTMFGLVGLMPDYSMIVVGANMGVSRMTREHLGISLALGIPIYVVVTKIDIAPPDVYKETINTLEKILKHPQAGRVPCLVEEGKSDIPMMARGVNEAKLSPIFPISNVTGQGLPQLKQFLGLLTSRVSASAQFGTDTDPVEYFIDSIYMVSGVGVVVAGTMLAGTVVPGQTLQLGPDKRGQFKPVKVCSIHHKRVEVESAVAGQAVCFGIKSLVKNEKLKRNDFRKGMILVDKNSTPQPIFDFEAEVVILHHATTIKPNYQAVIHCGVIRQAAKVVDMDNDLLRTGDKGLIRFRYMYRPEFLKVGTTVLFREGRTKGLGVVSRVFPPEKNAQTPNMGMQAGSKH